MMKNGYAALMKRKTIRDAIVMDMVRCDAKSFLAHAEELRALGTTPADDSLIISGMIELRIEEWQASEIEHLDMG